MCAPLAVRPSFSPPPTLPSISTPQADVAGTEFPRELMRWSADFYRPVLDAVVTPSSRGAFALSEHDYVLRDSSGGAQGDRKFGGNAQTISRDRWVHHTSLLWDFSPARMGLLRLPDKRPAYRGDRPHGTFLTRLREHVQAERATPEALFAAAEEQLRRAFQVEHADPAEAWSVLANTKERQSNVVVEY